MAQDINDQLQSCLRQYQSLQQLDAFPQDCNSPTLQFIRQDTGLFTSVGRAAEREERTDAKPEMA